jgi:ATP-dependent helicase/nuclease subunit A
VATADAPLKNEPYQPTVRLEPAFMPSHARLTLPSTTATPQTDDANLAAQKGKALHRLLQWQSTDAAALAAVAAEFTLLKQDAVAVATSANQMLAGEAAWLWDETKIDWQANEYELVYEGRVLRMDRLIKHRETQTWWVIDFKSALSPEKSAALQAQLKAYQAAVAAVFKVPVSQVKTAFVTGDGRLALVSDKL